MIGPYEMEHEYGLIGGNIFHGELSPEQLFHMRPAPGYADYRTPIAGLYQASRPPTGAAGCAASPARQADEASAAAAGGRPSAAPVTAPGPAGPCSRPGRWPSSGPATGRGPSAAS